jgi:hypothetical protein
MAKLKVVGKPQSTGAVVGLAAPAWSRVGGCKIAHQERDALFVTWYTYDRDGSPAWYVMSDVRLSSDGRYYGYIYRATAAPSQGAFNLVKSASVRQVGIATFGFSGPDNGTFTYTLEGSTYVKAITRQVFSPETTICAYTSTLPATGKYQDLWWNAPADSEAGWGVQIAHQGDTLFATLFGYDAAGEPRWRVISGARQDFARDVHGRNLQHPRARLGLHAVEPCRRIHAPRRLWSVHVLGVLGGIVHHPTLPCLAGPPAAEVDHAPGVQRLPDRLQLIPVGSANPLHDEANPAPHLRDQPDEQQQEQHQQPEEDDGMRER